MDDNAIKAAAMMLDHCGKEQHAATVREMAGEIARLRAENKALRGEALKTYRDRAYMKAQLDRTDAVLREVQERCSVQNYVWSSGRIDIHILGPVETLERLRELLKP